MSNNLVEATCDNTPPNPTDKALNRVLTKSGKKKDYRRDNPHFLAWLHNLRRERRKKQKLKKELKKLEQELICPSTTYSSRPVIDAMMNAKKTEIENFHISKQKYK